MKAVQIHDYGGSDVLSYEEVPEPVAADDEVLVRVRAASASPIDWKTREGFLRAWGYELPMPLVLGRAFAGDVLAVGKYVSGFEVGDKVYGSIGELHRGTYSTYLAVRPSEIAPLPKTLDYDHAATVPHSGEVAWQSLMEAGQLQPGQTVLVHAAAGGVGSWAVQIAKAQGAHVIGTSSDWNLDFLRSLGADEVIDYNNTRFEDVAHDVDIVLDLVGGDTQDRSWAVIKPGGVLVTLMGFGPTSREMAQARGVRAEMVAQRPAAEHLQTLGRMIDEGQIHPVVNEVLPLSQVKRAHDRLQEGHVRGKIILHFDDD